MSKISLSPSPTGSAVYTIASPAGSTDRTLTLPDGSGALYNQSNILGTVSQSGGVPTGAIIERGSNANGEFVKYADGTMICLSTEIPTQPNISSGQIFRSDQATFTYPATFSSAPTNTGNSGSLNRWIATSIPGTSSVPFRSWAAVSSSVEVGAKLQSIGRWF